MAETTAMACPLGRPKMHDLYQLTPHASLSGVQENEKKKSKKNKLR
jgi:hypothetical protein